MNDFTNDNISLIFPANNEIIKKAIVIIPAIIWFSVILDANIPIDNVAKLINKNPNIATKVDNILAFPKKLVIAKNINEITNVIIITNNAASNLPITILNILTGDVRSNCSVPVFLSSANILIVKIGTIIINPYKAV